MSTKERTTATRALKHGHRSRISEHLDELLPAPGENGEFHVEVSTYNRLWTLARNLWWTWQPELTRLFRELDPIRWRQLGHNPIALLSELSPERLDQRVNELVLRSQINHAYHRLEEYLASDSTWGAIRAGVLRVRPVAYFRRSSDCMSRCRFIRVALACWQGTTSKARRTSVFLWWPSVCTTRRATFGSA